MILLHFERIITSSYLPFSLLSFLFYFMKFCFLAYSFHLDMMFHQYNKNAHTTPIKFFICIVNCHLPFLESLTSLALQLAMYSVVNFSFFFFQS